MPKLMSLYDAKTNLSALVEEATAGDRDHEERQAEGAAGCLGARRPQARPFGLYRGRIRYAEDFDAPWPEHIRKALEGENPIEPDDASSSG